MKEPWGEKLKFNLRRRVYHPLNITKGSPTYSMGFFVHCMWDSLSRFQTKMARRVEASNKL